MRYIDSGSRNLAEALGTWLQNEPVSVVAELRWQSGFFSADGLQPLVPILQHLASSNSVTRVLIGSNESDTLESDVVQLVALLGLPRSAASLGVVSYSGAYYHPKVYHVRRTDGSQAAYVGSANLTLAGVSSLHVEAGLILDTSEGDPSHVLDSIANSVDAWFHGGRLGVETVADPTDVTRLAAAGILSVARPPRPAASTGSSTSGTAPRPRLQPLVRFPALPGSVVGSAAGSGSSSPSPAITGGAATVSGSAGSSGSSASLAAVPQSPPFPPYVLFAPGAVNPTSGLSALTGATLPGGSVGLVIRLNRDSARYWLGRSGTANISVPVPTVQTLRFGMYQGRYQRPRAEYRLQMRHITAGGNYLAAEADTNVMVYGFAAGESGHGDVRMVVPARPAREIGEHAARGDIAAPTDGDVALLEWPTPSQPAFRVSLIDRSLPLYGYVSSMLTSAAATGQLVGQGACWLPAGVSPSW